MLGAAVSLGALGYGTGVNHGAIPDSMPPPDVQFQ